MRNAYADNPNGYSLQQGMQLILQFINILEDDNKKT